MGEMSILSHNGAEKITWDPKIFDEIIKAREKFQFLLGKGYSAFHIMDTGGEGKKIKSFDSSAEKIIMVPKLGGG